jgi:hypothetical protein
MLANASKIHRISTVLFPTINKAGDVLSPYIGKPDIYRTKILVSAAIFSIYRSFLPAFEQIKLLPTYLNFYADKYPAYQ